MKENNNVWDETLVDEHGTKMIDLLEKEISRFDFSD